MHLVPRVHRARCALRFVVLTGLLAAGMAGPARAASWTIQSMPEARGSAERLSAVSCASQTACVSVGTVTNKSVTIIRRIEPEEEGIAELITLSEAPLAELWNGSSWTLMEPLAPSNTTVTTLKAVSCPREAYCMVVGTL